MPASLSTIVAKDGNGTIITGALQALDLSGAGTGPWSMANILVDGVSGTLRASVTASNALKVDGSAVTQPVSQATAASLNATVVGTGTFAVQATLNAETTKVIGTVRNVGNIGGAFDFIGQNATAPANSILIGGEFNTTPTTITSGNASPLQLDNGGNLLAKSKVWDGTNTATIKAASTAPISSDTAIVVAISPNSVNINGRNTPANSAPVVEASRTYQDVAASATATVLGSTGATGDWLEGILVVPETTGAGTVALLDLSTSVNVFVTGTLTSLVPFYVPMGCLSKNGAWKITTGANVHIRAFGNFT